MQLFLRKSLYTQNFGCGLLKRCFRYLLGSAGGFAERIKGSADPNDARFGGLAAVVLSADVAHQKACEWVCGSRRWLFIELSRPPCLLSLNRLKGLHINNSFVGVLSVVLRQFTVVYDGFLRDMVLTEGFLQKQIARIGVVAQYLGNHRLVPFPTEAGRNTFFRQPFGNIAVSFCIYANPPDK